MNSLFLFQAYPREVEMFIACYGTAPKDTCAAGCSRDEPRVYVVVHLRLESPKNIHWVSGFGTRRFSPMTNFPIGLVDWF